MIIDFYPTIILSSTCTVISTTIKSPEIQELNCINIVVHKGGNANY